VSLRKYDNEIDIELKNLILKAETKEMESRLRSVSTAVNRWKKGSQDALSTLSEVKRLAGSPSISWAEGADPGVAVAHALNSGLLEKTDISEKTWKAIEVLVTLVEI
jgi:hypothetical protein